MQPMWIDTHCHLDAPPFGACGFAPDGLRARARALGVVRCVYPAVQRANWDAVRVLAHRQDDAYALGIHPLCVPTAGPDDLCALEHALIEHRNDPRLVALGEIGLDFFVAGPDQAAARERQGHFYLAQLRLARRFGLPVLLHSRRAVDAVLQGLRQAGAGPGPAWPGGIAHAFNGSFQQAAQLLQWGCKLGFGGAATFDTAHQLRRLWAALPLSGLVLETDAPDMPPQWLYVTAAQRAQGQVTPCNSPLELPKIGAILAHLRGLGPEALAEVTSANALQALPKLAAF